MARLARLCVPGWPHLITQFGHDHGPVFRDDEDRSTFLNLLGVESANAGVAIHAYGLSDSEIRLLGTPAEATGLSRMMQAIGRRYGSGFNRRHGHAGSLWAGRFRATVIEPERHLLTCMRYVEELPRDAEFGGAATGGKAWTSAAHHVGAQADPLVSDHLQYWSLGNTPFEREAAYRDLLQHALTPREKAGIAEAAHKGWPLGSANFLAELSASTPRRLSPLPRGRPRGIS